MVGRSAGPRWLAGLVLGAAATGAHAQTQDGWQTLGLLRIRDMTPWGLTRLDFLPAHAFPSTPGTFAVEVNMSYQNTWAQSGNVEDFLDARGKKRIDLSPADISAIFALGGDAYLVDGEYGLLDLTLHYKFTRHWGAYLTIPYFTFSGGLLDSPIEGFHDAFGLTNSGRDNLPRNRWQVVAKVDGAEFTYSSPPANSLGDPVLGLRYSLNEAAASWNLVTELAAKVPRQDAEFMVSSGKPDFGIQLSLQRFLAHNAFYVTASAVYVKSPDLRLAEHQWIPTLILGWETRVSQHINFVLQTYASRSTVQETNLDELSADKLQATGGLQWSYHGNVLRFGITENLANFNNTPDIGVTLSFVRVFVRP